jgi:tetratricopeptide (TPR) repeat protein
LDEIEEATNYYDQALALSPEIVSQREDWRHLVILHKEECIKQNGFLNQLLNHPSSNQWVSLLRQNQPLIDMDDLVEVAKSRAQRQAVLNQYDQANKSATLVDSILAFRGDAPEFRRELVNYYINENEFFQAETLLRVIMKEAPDDEELEFSLAHSLLQQGKLDEGKQTLNAIIKSDPNNALAHSYLGQTYATEEQWNLAKRHLETALQINPNDSMARQFLDLIPAASVSYDPKSKVITIDGDTSSASTQDMAEALMAAIIAGNPEQKDELLKSIAVEKDEEAARRIASRIFADVANRQVTHFEEAERLFGAKRYQDAIEEYKLAIAEKSENWQAYLGLGDAYYMMGEYQLAAAYFEESVAIQPHAPTYRYLGDSYLRMGQLNKAIETYQRSVDTDQNYGPAKEALQMALIQKNDKL